MNRFFGICLRAAVSMAAAATLLSSQAALAQPSTIVDTPYVIGAIKRQAIIWDIRSTADYAQGHIPGAINIGDIRVALRDENSEEYLALDELEKRLGAAGIDPAKEIVVYGAKANPSAYFGLVTLQYLGAVNARVYHGGIDDWKVSGATLTTAHTRLTPLTLKLKVRPELLINTAEVVRRLHDPSVQIVDARRPTEYSGEEIHAIRGGHIPGAIPIYYMQNWTDPDAQTKLEEKQVDNKDGMNLKSNEQLRALYSRLDPNKETIVYCQSGVRASETANVLKSLGFTHVRVYKSSWLGYGNTLDAPAENVTFFNIDLLQDKLHTLQKRVESIEKELPANASK
jgi:thiosulfate/3-mercaptopyruvate sulfurtransferase